MKTKTKHALTAEFERIIKGAGATFTDVSNFSGSTGETKVAKGNKVEALIQKGNRTKWATKGWNAALASVLSLLMKKKIPTLLKKDIRGNYKLLIGKKEIKKSLVDEETVDEKWDKIMDLALKDFYSPDFQPDFMVLSLKLKKAYKRLLHPTWKERIVYWIRKLL